MKLGIQFDLRNPQPWRRDHASLYARTLELCAEFERQGGDAVWFTEHHLYEDQHLSQPLTIAAAAAARTSRVRIGTGVLLAPLRSAVHIAEEAAVVDLVSNGRLDLGLGAGYSEPEFDLYDADFAHRSSGLLRRIREIRELWADGRAVPGPAQERLPIWGGVSGARTARELGRMGESLLRLDPAIVAPYLEGVREAGIPEGEVHVGGPVNVFLTDDPERDWAAFAPRLAWQRDMYNRHGLVGPTAPPVDPAEVVRIGLSRHLTRDGFFFGTPEEAVAALRPRLVGVPAEHIYIWGDVALLDDELVQRNIELACARLRPLLQQLD